MIVNYAIISIVFLYVFKQFKKNYYEGLFISLFFLVLLPNTVTIEIGGSLPSITLHRIIICVWFMNWMKQPQLNRKITTLPFSRIFILSFFGIVFATVLSTNTLVSFKRLLYYVIESLLIYFMLASSLIDRQTINKSIIYIFYGLLFVSIFGIIEKYTGFNINYYLPQKHRYGFEAVRMGAGNIYSGGIYSLDVASTYLHRILFGIACAISLIYNLYILNKKKEKKYLLFLVINGMALYFSLSRGPWLAGIISVVFLTFFYRKAYLKYAIYGFIFLVCMMMLRPGILYTIQGYYDSTFNSDSLKGSSYQWRYIVWEKALSENRKASIGNAIFGSGLGSQIYTDFGEVKLPSGEYIHMKSWDNEYAIILFERGIFGLILAIYFYLYITLLLFKNTIKDKKTREMAYIAFAGCLVIIFMKSNVSIFTPQLVYLENFNLAVLGALLIRGVHTKKENANASSIVE